MYPLAATVGGLTCSLSEPEPQEGFSRVAMVCGLTPIDKGSL